MLIYLHCVGHIGKLHRCVDKADGTETPIIPKQLFYEQKRPILLIDNCSISLSFHQSVIRLNAFVNSQYI